MKRLEEILKLVSQYEKIDVNTLSETLEVSKVTIRKDLDKLKLLTNVMKKGYLDLINNNSSIDKFVANIIETWFRFYNLTFEDKDLTELTSL